MKKIKRTYDYLIAYRFDSDKFVGPGTGSIRLALNNKIKTFEDLDNIIDYIIKNNEEANGLKMRNVSIYNFILLGRNKH